MRLEFFPLLGTRFITEWNLELIFLDLCHLMHFNVCAPNPSFYRAPPPHIFPFLFTLLWGVGKWVGEASFKIPTLIKADTQPSHECIWRNVPIFKTNDDCLALLRKMDLPRGPRQPCVDEAEITPMHPGENIHLRRAVKVVGDFLKGKSGCLGI